MSATTSATSASIRRMRCCLNSLASVVSRTRCAAAGVGRLRHSASVHGAAMSSPIAARNCG